MGPLWSVLRLASTTPVPAVAPSPQRIASVLELPHTSSQADTFCFTSPSCLDGMDAHRMLTDDAVAELLAKEASEASIKYSSMGLAAFTSSK